MKNTKEPKVLPFELDGVSVKPGTRAKVELPLAQLYTQTPLNVPIHVIHGRKPGPVLMVSAAIHGDELNGVEIIRRLLRHCYGTVIARLCAACRPRNPLFTPPGQIMLHGADDALGEE